MASFYLNKFNIKTHDMKNVRSIATMAFLFMALGVFSQSKDDKRVIADAEKAKINLKKMDKGLAMYFKNSNGYVIFPNVGEGGLIVGAASGNGAVYEHGKVIGMADLKKLDIGIQAGGQSLCEVIFFETKEALNEFKEGKFEFSAEASAVVLEEGASANANYNDGVVVFAMPKKGLMADLSVGGQKFGYTAMNKN